MPALACSRTESLGGMETAVETQNGSKTTNRTKSETEGIVGGAEEGGSKEGGRKDTRPAGGLTKYVKQKIPREGEMGEWGES